MLCLICEKLLTEVIHVSLLTPPSYKLVHAKTLQEERLTNLKGSWEFLHDRKIETGLFFSKIDMFSFTVKQTFDQSYCLCFA